jgi:hypothetical protein
MRPEVTSKPCGRPSGVGCGQPFQEAVGRVACKDRRNCNAGCVLMCRRSFGQ